jgi:hypothetical protein
MNLSVLMRLLTQTTFLPTFAGLLALAGGLGLFDGTSAQQGWGVGGALLISLTSFRPHTALRLRDTRGTEISNADPS